MNRKVVILLSGLLVGTMDILAAFIDYYIQTGKGPEGVLRFIASGAFGTEAFIGPSTAVWWGLLFHYCFAMAWTALFFWLYTKFNLRDFNYIFLAILYGIAISIIMNLIVMPLSKTPAIPLSAGRMLKAMLILIAMIGLPLATIARNHFSVKYEGE